MELFKKPNLIRCGWLKMLWLSLIVLFTFSWAYADGSKDLYPSGATNLGARAWLRASTSTDQSYPFANLGTHYVYAKVGETIAIASSAQGIGSNSRLMLYAPDGSMIFSHQTPTSGANSSVGKIASRTEEVAGPQLPGQSVANRYTPRTHNATVEGIYKVEFISTGGSSSAGTGGPSSNLAHNHNWSQNNNTSLIAAWDISVANTANNAWITGRVYSLVQSLFVSSSTNSDLGFHGKVKVLTSDGYIYNVNNNGSNGIAFTFFVNNKGFITESGGVKVPSYKSLNESTVDFLGDKVHDPNAADTESDFTQKIFYTIPNTDLPAQSVGAVVGGSTWLKKTRLKPTVSSAVVKGVDGTVGQVSNKGGQVEFVTNLPGSYSIKIESTSSPVAFVERILTGVAVMGNNVAQWDGKDGAGIPIPNGNVPVKLTLVLQGGEVHFPFLDMEINPNGTIIELLKEDGSGVESDIVYWNDSEITITTGSSSQVPKANSTGGRPDPLNADQTVYPNGNSSNLGPKKHTWGTSTTDVSSSFGNRRSIDTWTFVRGEEKQVNTTIEVKVADLKISSINHDKGGTEVKVNDIVTYTIKVKNDGPSDIAGAPFGFILPAGFIPDPDATIDFGGNNCGTQSSSIAYSGGKYSSALNLPNGCEITYTIKVKATDAIVKGANIATATILRPNDVTDPDATNPDANIPPTDPFYECANNGQSGICNNILSTSITVAPRADLSIVKFASTNSPHVGDIVTFTIMVTNSGPDVATNVKVTDIVNLDHYTIGQIGNNGVQNPAGTIVWTIPTLATGPGASVTFTATVKAGGDISNTASVLSDVEDPNPNNNTSKVVVTGCAAPTGQVPLKGTTLNNK